MKAMDVMVRNVITVKPEDAVTTAIKLLAEHDISALPVVDDGGKVVGVISEADLMRREEIGTERHRAWWLEAMTPGSVLAGEFAKAHGRTVREIMSTGVVSAAEETPLAEIANLIQALAMSPVPPGDDAPSDRSIRGELLDRLGEQTWTDFGSSNVIVRDGIVHLWGLVGSPQEHKALLALAEQVAGVKAVSDETFPAY